MNTSDRPLTAPRRGHAAGILLCWRHRKTVVGTSDTGEPRQRDHPLYPGGHAPETVAIAGDWHGNAFFATQQLERIAPHARVVLHCGDWGLWRESPSMAKFKSRQNRVLEAHEMTLVVAAPGNHEDYDVLARLPVDERSGLLKITNRIYVGPRPYRWRYGDTEWLAVGGAISVDRDRRTLGRDYWAEEAITDDDVDAAIAGGPADVLISHDAIGGAHVPGLDPNQWPAEAIADSDENRRRLRRIADAVRPRWAYSGHMHVRFGDRIDLGGWSEDRPDWDGVLHVHGLDCDQGARADNVVLAGADGAPQPWPEDAQ